MTSDGNRTPAIGARRQNGPVTIRGRPGVVVVVADWFVGFEATAVPGWQRVCERAGAFDPDAAAANCVCPLDALEVPVGQGPRVGLDDEILLEPRIVLADLGVAMIDEQPDPSVVGRLVRELEPDYHPAVREPL